MKIVKKWFFEAVYVSFIIFLFYLIYNVTVMKYWEEITFFSIFTIIAISITFVIGSLEEYGINKKDIYKLMVRLNLLTLCSSFTIFCCGKTENLQFGAGYVVCCSFVILLLLEIKAAMSSN